MHNPERRLDFRPQNHVFFIKAEVRGASQVRVLLVRACGILLVIGMILALTAGSSYGNEITFTSYLLPAVSTGVATSINSGGATLNGHIMPYAGQNATARGFRYRKQGTSSWTVWTENGSFGICDYSHPVSGLKASTTYEFEALATNEAGTAYGGAMTFATTKPTTWYLAEGNSAWGFETYISIINPNSAPVTVDLTYMPSGQANKVQTIKMVPNSRATVYPGELLGEKDFSTKVNCREGLTIAADRNMEWTGDGASTPECHSSIGVTAPAKTWYLPEGSTNWGFETWLLIQNPNSTKANCTVTYMIEGEGPKDVTHEVPANSRASFSMATDIGNKDASIKVTSDQNVIPERAMYRNNRREGHDSIGTTTPTNDYYLAEGTTGWGFTTYVLIQNPNTSAANVNVTFMTPEGAVPYTGNPINMPANSRKTIRVNDYLAKKDFSTKVSGDKGIIAERAMYWDSGKGEACHDSIGMRAPHAIFYLPCGQAGSDVETWILVQNPNSSSVHVHLTYMAENGGAPKVVEADIPANSRKSFNMTDAGISGRHAIQVSSQTSGKKIMVERAMYFYARGAGTDTVGGFED